MRQLSGLERNGPGDCWAKDICKQFRRDGGSTCTTKCGGYLLLNYLYEQAGIPYSLQRSRIADLKASADDGPDYQESLENLQRYVEKVKELVPKGLGLYLFAKPTDSNRMGTGTGKSTAAAAIMNEWLLRNAYDLTYLEPIGLWIPVPEWLDALRNSFDGIPLPERFSPSLMGSVPLLVLDDLGAEKGTEWVQERVYMVLNRRMSEGLATIVTSNYMVSQLGGRLNWRIASRLETLVALDMTGIDHRRGE